MRIYKGREEKDIPAIDAPGWLNAGWSLEAPETDTAKRSPIGESFSPPSAPPIQLDRDTREMELLTLYDEQGYRAIKDLAGSYGITKPEGGWDDAIALILDHEFKGQEQAE